MAIQPSAAQHRVAVIMAGGSGERFWPLSRGHRPKQLLRLGEGTETMLQEAVSRIAPLVGADNVFVATSVELREAIRAGDPRVPPANVLAEPMRRNTSGALIWAAASLVARYGDPASITMGVLTADHQIGQPDVFRRTIAKAMDTAEAHRCLVTIGAVPTRPDTGYGYIELANGQDSIQQAHALQSYRVSCFREKPNQTIAEEFVSTGIHLWNCGMFFWRVSTFLDELDHAAPKKGALARQITAALVAGDEDTAVRLFEKLQNISIDFALLENARHVEVIPADFPWDDVGTWDSLDRTRPVDEHENVCTGGAVLVDVHHSIVLNDAGADKKAVALIGVSDLIVVVADDAVLVVHKNRAQDVRRAVQELRKRGATQL